MRELSESPETLNQDPFMLLKHSKTLVANNPATKQLQGQNESDKHANERVTLLVIQALILNRVLLCQYLYDAFLEGKIRTFDNFHDIHHLKLNQEYISPSLSSTGQMVYPTKSEQQYSQACSV
jgi:hypothetical protein